MSLTRQHVQDQQNEQVSPNQQSAQYSVPPSFKYSVAPTSDSLPETHKDELFFDDDDADYADLDLDADSIAKKKTTVELNVEDKKKNH